MVEPRGASDAREPRERGLRAAALVGALLLTMPASAAAFGDERSKPESAPAAPVPIEKLLGEFADALRGGRIPTKEKLMSEMKRIGPESVDVAVKFARGEKIAGIAAAPIPGSAPSAAKEQSARDAVQGMLDRIPLAASVAIEPADLPAEERISTQRIGLAVLERIGASMDDVRLALDLAKAKNPEEGIEFPIVAPFEKCVGEILRRNRKLFGDYSLTLAKAPAAVQPNLIGALGSTCCREASQSIARMLGRWPAIDRLLIQQIGRSEGPLPLSLGDTEAASLRRYLDSRDPALRRETALAVGRLEDPEAAGQLVELLNDADHPVQENALWALRRISGLSFQDAKRWREWYDAERAWWTDVASGLLAKLDPSTPAVAAGALRDLVLRRLYRNEVTDKVVPLLTAKDAKLSRVAFAAVENLRSDRAIPPLIALLEDPSESTRKQAHQALLKITGETRPADKGAWESFLR